MPVGGRQTNKQFQKSVTMCVPAFAIGSGEIIALSSSFETKLVGSGSPFCMTRFIDESPA